MDNEQFGEMKESQNEADPVVEAVLEKCISIYKEIGKNEEKLYHDVRVPTPIVSKMYFDRARFVFEIMDHKLRFEYYFGPRYGRGMEFDIVETGDTVQFVNERNRWVS